MAALMFFFMEYIASFNRRLKRLRDEAEKDDLTGLVTSRRLNRSLTELIEAAIADHRSLSILYIDIDSFKSVNDSYGHLHGDRVLKEIGRIFKQAARSHDVISRNGGDEFTIILADCSLRQAVAVSERIRHAVEAYEFRLSESQRVNITVSIGIASLPETARERDLLLQLADEALYQAKRGGRNKIVVAGHASGQESLVTRVKQL
jgi:diguanylate cyclase